ncbi:MAG: hypothetical protein EP332_09655 [Bacteroidetes bacterium]|nr:MAG: hypothetical protein EP332_09655 [Bacteroidota bacterium]
MNRQQKRQRAKEARRSTNLAKENSTEVYESEYPSWLILLGSILIITVALYWGLRDKGISYGDLKTIEVTVEKEPVFEESRIKSTTYYSILLKAKEYNVDFAIGGMNYKASDIQGIKSNIHAGDKVNLRVLKSELDDFNERSFWHKHNEAYGLSKNGYQYVNLEFSEELEDNDSNYAFSLVLVGLVMLPYAFIKGKPRIKLEYAMFTGLMIGFIAVFLYQR